MHKRLVNAHLKPKLNIQTNAAVYCSSILQFLTSKVIMQAVQAIINGENEEELQINCKRNRNEFEREEKFVNIASSTNQAFKRRRICTKDIFSALKTLPSLKQWSNDIKQDSLPLQNGNNTELKQVMNGLKGMVIALEGNFKSTFNKSEYCSRLKEMLERQSFTDQENEQMFKDLFATNDVKTRTENRHLLLSMNLPSISSVIHGKNNNEIEEKSNILGFGFYEKRCKVLCEQFGKHKREYCAAWMYHLSCMLGQQLQCSRNILSSIKSSFAILDRSPISCLALAMHFVDKRWLTSEQFKQYLNAFQLELFPKNIIPNIILFIDHEHNGQYLYQKKKNSVFTFNDEFRGFDDFLFELIVKQLANKESKQKIIFFQQSQMMNVQFVSRVILDILVNDKHCVHICWQSDFQALADISAYAINCHRRIVYSEEEQIEDGLQLLLGARDVKVDMVYIHISLWMKPNKEIFKRLMMAHFCRFESICFYAICKQDLDHRANQVVQWLFSK